MLSGPGPDNALTGCPVFALQQYSLASAIEAAEAYTVFAPNNEAIESYIREKKVTTLVRVTAVVNVFLVKIDFYF